MQEHPTPAVGIWRTRSSVSQSLPVIGRAVITHDRPGRPIRRYDGAAGLRSDIPSRHNERAGNSAAARNGPAAAAPGTRQERVVMADTETAVTLARAQFAFTVMFHFVFPSFSIGLASYLAVLEGLWLRTGRLVYLGLFRFWLKIFAIVFAMGVVSGIVMSYQFGTNWAVFSDKAGSIIGPLMGYEVLTAFFLEAGFLGVMLFGMGRVGRRLHFTATLLVAIGTLFSSFWILSANSWMHTPAGFAMNAAGQFVPVDWWKVIFNPSFPYRLVHTVLGAYLTTALIVGAVGAWHLLREPAELHARVMFSMAMWMVVVVAPLQALAGDTQGLNTLEHQPAKIMAMEGHYQSHAHGAPLYLFGIPDQTEGRLRYAVGLPRVSSLVLKHDPNAPLAGLDTVERRNWPPVPIIFWSFRVMVGLGLLMIALGLTALIQRLRGRLWSTRWLHRFAVAMGPAGTIAVLAGWTTTEVGRQPFTVYGLLRTADSASPLAAPAVAASLAAFAIVYFIVFGTGLWYLFKLMARTPQAGEQPAIAGLKGPIRTAGITPAPAVIAKTGEETARG
jgi:cytochrome bd ubiquinol oxidase subunit I